jgi:hypothetical protein
MVGIYKPYPVGSRAGNPLEAAKVSTSIVYVITSNIAEHLYTKVHMEIKFGPQITGNLSYLYRTDLISWRIVMQMVTMSTAPMVVRGSEKEPRISESSG